MANKEKHKASHACKGLLVIPTQKVPCSTTLLYLSTWVVQYTTTLYFI